MTREERRKTKAQAEVIAASLKGNLDAAADHLNTLDDAAGRSFLRKIVLSAQHPDLVPILERFVEKIKARAVQRRTLN